MSLSDVSIRRPVFAWMLMLALIIFGYIAFTRMGVSQLPDVDFPMVNISVTYEGAAPEVMELDVVDAIESAVVAVEGVKSVTSSAKQGIANISVEFGLSKDINVAVSEVETRINQAAKYLPDEIDPPIITKVNPEDRPIMYMAVTSVDMPVPKLMSFVRDQLKDKFQTVAGVADLSMGGYVEPNLRVWVDAKKLDRYQLTITDVIDAIQSEHKEAPSGYLEDARHERSVRTMGEATSVADFMKIPMIRRGGSYNFSPVFLGEVANVEEGIADIRRISRSNGITAVGLGVRKQRGANSVAVADGVKKMMKELNKVMPKGTEIGVNYDSTEFINESIHELIFTISMAALLTAIVCWIFLGSFAATMNVVLAIPTSILGAFIILKFMGFTLNTFSLLGLSLAIGIVVDDAIMVLENIYRHHEEGKDRQRAARDGANEITSAAMAATIAIMAIFVPVALMDGIIGKYFFQFGVTISVAVGLSLLEALTLTPMRCAQFMEPAGQRGWLGRKVDEIFDRLVAWYHKSLIHVLDHKVSYLTVATVFFVTTCFLVKYIPKEMSPSQDTSSFMIRIKTPDGSSLAYTDEMGKKVEAWLKAKPEVKRFFTAIGGFGGGESNSAMMFVTMHHREDRPGKVRQQDLLDRYRQEVKEFKGGKVFIQDMSQGGFSASGRGFPVEFTLVGPQWDGLIESAKAVMAEMTASGAYTDVDTDYKESVQEVHVVPDRDAAKRFGVSVNEVGRTINALIGGLAVAKFSKDGHRNDVRVKMVDVDPNEAHTLEHIHVRNTRGELVRLLDVAKVEVRPGTTAVSRRDRARAISIYAGIAKGSSQEQALNLVKAITAKHLKPGYRMLESGSSEAFRDAMASLVMALAMGILIAYMVLGSQFNSFFDPVVVLLAMPFAFSGAFLMLWGLNLSLNMYSMIGLILLMGIVKKNSILIVEFTNQRREEGFDIRPALEDACPKRLRPILMTSFATVAGALPAALALGPGAEALGPMAWSIIGGTLVSTFLTLYVVPAFYLLAAPKKKLGEETRSAA